MIIAGTDPQAAYPDDVAWATLRPTRLLTVCHQCGATLHLTEGDLPAYLDDAPLVCWPCDQLTLQHG